MSEAPLTFRTQVLERDDVPRLQGVVNVTTSANDTLAWSHTIEEHDFLGDSWRTLGVAVDVDRGEGALSPLTDAEMPSTISLTGSIEGFGVRELSFGKLGGGQSPLRVAALRGPRRVRMSGIRGTLGGYREWPMFDGFFRDTGVALFPPAATITAQDGSVLARLISYTLAPRSGQTRLAIVTDILQRHGIRIGTFTFSDAENNGGYVYKEINEARTRSVLEFLGEFLLPTGCRPYWRHDVRGKWALHIRRFAITDLSKRTLTFSDIRSLTVVPPAANVPNVVRVASDIYPSAGPQKNGVYVETSNVVNAVYQKVVATHKQDHTTGVISALALSSSPVLQEVSKVVTTSTYVAGTLTAQTIETYGWYAPKASNRKQNADGTTRYNEDFTVYKFPDLTWRFQQEETYQVIKKRVITRSFSPTAHVLAFEAETRYSYYDLWAPTGRRNSGNTATVPIANVYMTDDGNGWFYGRERIDTSATMLPFTLHRWSGWDASSRLVNTIYENIYFAPLLQTYTSNGTVSIGDAYVFGPISVGHTYGIAIPSLGGLKEAWVHTIAATSETSYLRTATLTGNNGAGRIQWNISSYVMDLSGGNPVTIQTPQPVIEMEVAYEAHRPAAWTGEDKIRIALSNNTELAENIEAGWCETVAEQETVSRERLRELGAFNVDLTMDLDWDLCEGDVITIPPSADLGPEERDLLIRSATRSVDAANPGNSSLQLSCWALPQELV